MFRSRLERNLRRNNSFASGGCRVGPNCSGSRILQQARDQNSAPMPRPHRQTYQPATCMMRRFQASSPPRFIALCPRSHGPGSWQTLTGDSRPPPRPEGRVLEAFGGLPPRERKPFPVLSPLSAAPRHVVRIPFPPNVGQEVCSRRGMRAVRRTPGWDAVTTSFITSRSPPPPTGFLFPFFCFDSRTNRGGGNHRRPFPPAPARRFVQVSECRGDTESPIAFPQCFPPAPRRAVRDWMCEVSTATA